MLFYLLSSWEIQNSMKNTKAVPLMKNITISKGQQKKFRILLWSDCWISEVLLKLLITNIYGLLMEARRWLKLNCFIYNRTLANFHMFSLLALSYPLWPAPYSYNRSRPWPSNLHKGIASATPTLLFLATLFLSSPL